MTDYDSAVDENIRYYEEHPDKFTPAKIAKETWIPERIRARIAVYLYEITRYGERKRRARRRQLREIQGIEKPEKPSRRRYEFRSDKNHINHKVEIKTGRYVHLNKAEQARRKAAFRK